MICPNCGRRNPAGATFCSRCKQRLPLATRYSGQGYKRAVIAEPSGGGSGGVLVLGVALLAAFIFIGGGAAIYLSTPSASQIPTNLVANGSPDSSLPVFVQDTPTPIATPSAIPTPFFFSPDPGSFTPLPTDLLTPTPSVVPTPTPTSGGPTPTPTPKPTPKPTPTPSATPIPAPKAKFAYTQQVGTLNVKFTNTSSNATTYAWDFGDPTSAANNTSTKKSPLHTFSAAGDFMVTLTVTGPGGTSAPLMKTVRVAPPPPKVMFTCDSSVVATLTCTSTSTGTGNLTYQWASNPVGMTSSDPTLSQVTFTYDPSVTSAKIKLTVTDSNGPASKILPFVVNQPVTPGASIQGEPLAILGSAPVAVRRQRGCRRLRLNRTAAGS